MIVARTLAGRKEKVKRGESQALELRIGRYRVLLTLQPYIYRTQRHAHIDHGCIPLSSRGEHQAEQQTVQTLVFLFEAFGPVGNFAESGRSVSP